MITHVVIFYADKPHGENKEKILAGAKSLVDIPGVLEFRCGGPIPSARGAVDDSFAVAISMTFENQTDADAYQNHEIHQNFIENTFKPYCKRFVVYDFGE